MYERNYTSQDLRQEAEETLYQLQGRDNFIEQKQEWEEANGEDS
jgi:hypothetical protein